MSLRQRLPILICILLLAIIITFSGIAWYGVRNASMAVGGERLRTLTDQLSAMFQKSAVNVTGQLLAGARNDSVTRFVQTGDNRFRAPALATLDRLRIDTLTLLVELLDSTHKPVLSSVAKPVQININREQVLAALSPTDSSVAGRFYKAGDSIYFPVTAVVKSGGKTTGYLLQWHLLYASPEALEQLSQLMGTQATLYFGNNDGSLWTDYVKQVAPPPAVKPGKNGITAYSRVPGKPVLAAQAPIPGTPWLVLVEFSRKSVMSAADRFLYWTLISGLLLIIVAIVVTTILSRNITRPLKKLTTAISSLSSSGNAPLTVHTNRKDEIGQLARAFNNMTVEITAARQDLENKMTETQDMNEQLRSLSAYIQNIREEERIHIAREMHDELGQLLTAFKMDIVYLRKKLGENSEPVIHEKINDMVDEIDEAIKFVRRLSAELRPQILDDLGLIPALEWFSMEFTKRYSIDVLFYADTDEFKTSSLVATSLFRMYQESLTNVARHSEATTVETKLLIENDRLSLTITDNGKGFDMQTYKQKKSLGLLGLKERAFMIDGRLDINSSPGKGTVVHIEVPLQQTRETVPAGGSRKANN